METFSTITKRHFAKTCGRSSSLILRRSSIWTSVKNKMRKCAKCDVYNFTRFMKSRLTEISNFEKVAKIYFVSNMASRSTVSLKPFLSKRCFMVCQQNLVVELYYGYTMDLENLVAFPKATMKLQTVKSGSSIENLTISLNFAQI